MATHKNKMAYSLKIKSEKVPMYLIKAKNYEAGHHWFSKDTMRFFNSKVPEEAYKKGDKAYFISQEKSSFDNYTPEYTIRVADLNTGEVDTVGEFGQYKSKYEAKKELKKILEN